MSDAAPKAPENWSKTDLRRNNLADGKRRLDPRIVLDGNPLEIDEILFDVDEETQVHP